MDCIHPYDLALDGLHPSLWSCFRWIASIPMILL